jgi:rRNA-processing protein FCF1
MGVGKVVEENMYENLPRFFVTFCCYREIEQIKFLARRTTISINSKMAIVDTCQHHKNKCLDTPLVNTEE